jgi:hypothetical protein
VSALTSLALLLFLSVFQALRQPAHIASPRELETPSLFRSLGLELLKKERVVLCTSCRIGLLADHVVGHLREKHRAVKIDEKAVRKELSDCKVVNEFPAHPSGPINAISGLAMHMAFQCKHCPKLYAKFSSLSAHHRIQHPNRQLNQTEDHQTVPCQKWNNSYARSYFPVQLQSSASPVPEPKDETFLHQVQKDMKTKATHHVITSDISDGHSGRFWVGSDVGSQLGFEIRTDIKTDQNRP